MIYFDITDLFNYLRKNRNVTGIQRVQIKILQALTLQAPNQIKCLIIDTEAPLQDRIKVYRADDLFANKNDVTTIIKSLLPQRAREPLLDPAGVRSALQIYSNRKLFRGFKKIELYLCRLMAPGRLAQLGYREEIGSPVVTPSAEPFYGPHEDDLYVLLGHNWNTPEIGALACTFRSAGGKAVQVIHDVIPAKMPAFFPAKAAKDFKEYLYRCCDTFEFFIAVSENTRKDLLSCFAERIESTSIKVLRLAHAFGDKTRNAPCSSVFDVDLTPLTRKPFVVSVGTIEPRKNHSALIRVWSRLHQELKEQTPTLVIAGKLGWKTDAFIDQLATAKRQGVPILHLMSASDEYLHFLYANCLFSIYPSLYEGWGLPVGESLWLGRPCLASNASSIPEIAEEGVAYFDPLNEDDMLDSVRRLSIDRAHLAELECEVKAATLRDWPQVAHDLMDILKSFRTKT